MVLIQSRLHFIPGCICLRHEDETVWHKIILVIASLMASLNRQLTLQAIFGALIALQNVLSLSIFNSNLLSFYERALDV